MKQAVVVIPIYREILKLSEKAALEQVRRVLGAYDICFMAPERMKGFLEHRGEWGEYWPDDCFADVRAYSHLLLTEEFYSRFIEYEYMLLYQLDAFVFSDRLQEFCLMGYDYIGAPMPHWTGWKHTKVGNGGLSLRKISACLDVTKNKQEIYKRTGRGDEFEFAEDKFFGYCGYDEQILFTTPDARTALSFAVEYDVMKAYSRLSEDNLPFGCHAWSKAWYWRIWEPFIRIRAIDWEAIRTQELEIMPSISYSELRCKALMQYLIRRLCRNERLPEADIDAIIPQGTTCVLWGGGEIGGRTKTLLEKCGRKIRCFIDSSKKLTEIEEIEVLPPERLAETMSSSKVIISVTKDKYVKEIISSLDRMGLDAGREYVAYEDICFCLVKHYWRRSVGRWLGGDGQGVDPKEKRTNPIDSCVQVIM